MRLLRVIDPSSNQPTWAVEADGYLRTLNDSLDALTGLIEAGRSPSLGHPFVVHDDKVLPCAEPTKIVCVGLNYQHHADEMGKTVPEEPLIFMKPPSALNRHGGVIELPPQSELVHHEGELVMVVGRRARKVSVEDAHRHILGYTCGNDVTARDIQRREARYTRGKGFDTFAPVGPSMVTFDEFQPAEHRIQTRVNGAIRQDSSLDDFIFGLDQVVSFISHVMTLEPGDLIFTGTPMGVGPLEDGDVVEVEIDGIGVLENTARAIS